MFTGIIEEMGTVKRITQLRESIELTVHCVQNRQGMKLGDSIAVDGVCLTVTALEDDSFTALVSAETLRKTTLGERKVGDRVNLESPLTLTTKLSGHMVQGHVDGTATVARIVPEGECQMWHFHLAPDLLRYLVPKGSVAVDGISLTVVDVTGETFSVAIIPKTLTLTTLQFRGPGDRVNIETDIIGKYVYHYMHAQTTKALEG